MDANVRRLWAGGELKFLLPERQTSKRIKS